MYIVQGEPCSLKCTISFTVRRLGICKYTQVEAASVKLCNPRRAGTFSILQKKVKTDLIILNLLRPNFFWSSSNEMWKLLISNIWGITYLGINDPRYKGGERWGQDVQNCKCFHPTGFSFPVNSYQPSMKSKRARLIADIKSTFDSFASGATLSKSPRQKSQVFEPASAALLSWSVHRLDLEAYAAGAASFETYKLCLT